MKAIAIAFTLVCSVSFAIEPFALPWMNHESPGTVFNTEDYPDGIFVIHPYFIHCPVNYQLEPKVNQLAVDYVDEPRVHVIDIGIDRSDLDYKKWIGGVNPNHPVLKDANREVVRSLGVTQFPTTIVLDGYGTVQYRSTPGVWSAKEEKEIRATIDWLLGKPVMERLL